MHTDFKLSSLFLILMEYYFKYLTHTIYCINGKYNTANMTNNYSMYWKIFSKLCFNEIFSFNWYWLIKVLFQKVLYWTFTFKKICIGIFIIQKHISSLVMKDLEFRKRMHLKIPSIICLVKDIYKSMYKVALWSKMCHSTSLFQWLFNWNIFK